MQDEKYSFDEENVDVVGSTSCLLFYLTQLINKEFVPISTSLFKQSINNSE